MSSSKSLFGRFELSRRGMIAVLCAGAIGAAAALPVAAQQQKGPSEVPVEELMKPVGLPDLALGPVDAKVTVVEYASMTCGHCAHFTKARCAGHEKTFPLIEVLFEKQNEWAFGEGNPVPRLFEIAKQAGFTQESFDKCLTDQKLLDEITAGRTRASEVFGVAATPTFYINGKKLDGGPTMEKFDAMIEPLLAKS